MAVSKNQKGKRKPASGKAKSGRTSSAKASSGKAQNQSVSSSFQTEIILLIILAAAVILMFSNFGMGGIVGDAISTFSFGAMGLMAYAFPVVMFVGAAFLLSNKHNKLAYKKSAAGAVFFIVMCGVMQLITEGYIRSRTLLDYYSISSDYHTGGGVIGGAICISTTSAFGVWGRYVIMILVLLVCLILITQHSFFEFLEQIWMFFYTMIRGGHARYKEGQPERELKKELRAKERQRQKEERQTERLRELEEALAEEDSDEEALPAKAKRSGKSGTRRGSGQEKASDMSSGSRRGRSAKRTASAQTQGESRGFLEGTELKPSGVRVHKTSVDIPMEEENREPDNLAVDTRESRQGQIEFRIHRSQPQAEEEEETLEDLFDTPEVQENIPDRKENISRQDEQPEPPFSEEKPKKSTKNPKSSPAEIENGIKNITHEISNQELPAKKVYHFPPLKLLKKGNGKSQGDSDEHLRKTAQKLQDTLHNFGVNVTVTNVSCGPTVTRYELQPEMGVKVSRIVGLADDIKLNLATPDIRIEAPIPGKAAVGIEVPNKENSAVMLRDLLQSREFQEAKSKLSFAVGKDIGGKPVVTDIAKMPHLLIAGATGSGKSVCINTLIISILYKATPDEVKLIMIDPKVVELSVYNGIPHLLIPVVTDPKKAAGALNWAVSEMTVRYNTFAEFGVRNLGEYNKKVENMRVPEGQERPKTLPQIVVIVDELADLMMVAPGEVEDAICRLAQLARAAGIHLVIATQRPSVNVITGLIKANMPSRIAFTVSSGVDSRTILDMNGAEKLLGKGDMLFYPQGYQKPARMQGALITDEEVSSIVDFLSDRNPAVEYNTQIEQQVNTAILPGGASGSDDRDVYFEEAGKFIIDKEKASIGMIQRMFKVGFNRAARIMDQLCEAGVVGPEEGTKPRKVLMTMEEFQNYIEEHV